MNLDGLVVEVEVVLQLAILGLLKGSLEGLLPGVELGSSLGLTFIVFRGLDFGLFLCVEVVQALRDNYNFASFLWLSHIDTY